MSLKSKRTGVMLWDCGCLMWRESDAFMLVPCLQDGCKVEPLAKEEAAKVGIPVLRFTVPMQVVRP